MLRVLVNICKERQSGVGREAFKLFRVRGYSSSTPANKDQTILSRDGGEPGADSARSPRAAPAPPVPQPPPPPPPRGARAWPALAALAATASLGGVYLYRRLSDNEADKSALGELVAEVSGEEAPSPARAEQLPAHVQYLLVGGGTASFAAMRAIRSARPDAQVLIVAEERALPYMRPPLSKELWREPQLAASAAAAPDALAFSQWNGRRRNLAYEPSAFYTPAERLREGGAGAGVARGWRVARIDPARHVALLEDAARTQAHELTYDKCLVATGVRPRRLAALRAAAAAGRSLALRGLRDAARLAAALEDPATRTVVIVGGSFLATELAAALAERLQASGDSGKRVVVVCGEEAPLARTLPPYLAQEAARRLRASGVELMAGAEVVASRVEGARVQLALADGARLEADLVVECAGSEPDAELARRSGLEVHPELGGVVVGAELQARADVFAAGDAACFYDVALGRRRVEHHDHAVVSGRLAGENMAALAPPKHYAHQSMFWSDLGPQLGYEAIGIIDSALPTVGVFSADAVGAAEVPSGGGEAGEAGGEARRYERGVVFYLRERRVVGVLLWNLFNRMHVARQVLTHGEFDDLFEVAKLFAPHREE